jgi:hypothetical protein
MLFFRTGSDRWAARLPADVALLMEFTHSLGRSLVFDEEAANRMLTQEMQCPNGIAHLGIQTHPG